ncbi:MAG: hypothetical protein JWP78_2935 [Mucilaginibacter sp.]|nr:hypothetical protein [Mucilaginibacter sp.]
MSKIIQLISRLKLKIRFRLATLDKTRFLVSESVRAVLFPVTEKKILFSADEGDEKYIRSGFRLLHHHIQFDAFTPENINKNDLVIPLNITDVRELLKFPHLTKNKLIPIPGLEAVNICDDKYLFIETLINKGFKDLLPEVGNDLSLPFMLKKKVAAGSENCFLISSPEQKLDYMELINSQDYFCQEIIQGTTEYCTHILFKDHKIATSLTIKYNFYGGTPISIKGKDKLCYKSICKSDHLDAFTAILNAIGYEGLCNFDYKIIDGKLKVFEINPRFGGSLSRYFFSFLRKLKEDNITVLNIAGGLYFSFLIL